MLPLSLSFFSVGILIILFFHIVLFLHICFVVLHGLLSSVTCACGHNTHVETQLVCWCAFFASAWCPVWNLCVQGCDNARRGISEQHHQHAYNAYNAYNAYRCPAMPTDARRCLQKMRGGASDFWGGGYPA